MGRGAGQKKKTENRQGFPDSWKGKNASKIILEGLIGKRRKSSIKKNG